MSGQADHVEIEKEHTRRRGWQSRYVEQVLSRLANGRLTVVLPSGETTASPSRANGPEAIVVLKSWKPLRRLLLGGDTALAQSYIDGEWETPDLLALFELSIVNRDQLLDVMTGSLVARVTRRIQHYFRGNSRRGSRRNIAFHYDLGNAFYRLWLDEQMVYSSALYDQPDLTLEAAQSRKMDIVIHALNAGYEDRVLEIGCGWGALALRLARSGATVTGLTLSAEQLAFAQAEASKTGLDGKMDLRLQDYRDVEGTFDRIVSVEMLEAVGEAYWPAYFKTLADLLTPTGSAIVQVITISEALYPSYRAAPDFIQQYVFPGGMLPTVDLLRQVAGACGLTMSRVRAFGESYALTLAEWRRRFRAATPDLERLGFDIAFRRMWDYYLAYCEAGFRAGQIEVGLYMFTKADIERAQRAKPLEESPPHKLSPFIGQRNARRDEGQH